MEHKLLQEVVFILSAAYSFAACVEAPQFLNDFNGMVGIIVFHGEQIAVELPGILYAEGLHE